MPKLESMPAPKEKLELSEEEEARLEELKKGSAKWEEQSLINLKDGIHKAKSIDDIYRIMDGFIDRDAKFISEKGKEYDPKMLKEAIEVVWREGGDGNMITASFGLRDRVLELRKIEETREEISKVA